VLKMEVVVTSECSGQLWNCCVWDPLTGTTLRTFKGGISCSKTLNILAGDYVISSQKDKPILQVWALNRQDQLTSKMIMPGIIQVLAVSPCNSFCVGAASEQIMIWQFSTGKMVASVRRHYQNVSNIKFTADSSYFVSTGTEGLVLVWSMESVLNSVNNDSEPDFTWSDHSLPVTGLYITNSLVQPLVFTVSLDQTCKVHDLYTGQTLLSIQFCEALHSVVVDQAEEFCFVGTSSGKIHQISLLNPPRNVEQVDELADQSKFIGHEKNINSLSISIDAGQLLSGSEDGTARIWDLSSGQCVRILQHRGPLTNAFFAPKFKHFETDKFQPSVLVNNFEKKRESQTPVNAEILVRVQPFLAPTHSMGPVVNEELGHSKMQNLQRVNQGLYKLMVKKILNKK